MDGIIRDPMICILDCKIFFYYYIHDITQSIKHILTFYNCRHVPDDTGFTGISISKPGDTLTCMR
jgi:hypothetical protein